MYPSHLTREEQTEWKLNLLTDQLKGDIREVRKSLLAKIEYHTRAKGDAEDMLRLLERTYIL